MQYYEISPAEYPSFCFGNVDNCAPCPCGNEAASTMRGGCVNATGWSAVLSYLGRASVSDDSLQFVGFGLNPNAFAVLISGDNALPNAGACAPGSGIPSPLLDGLRCVGGNVRRHGTRMSFGSGFVEGWGLPNGPPGGLVANGNFAAGQVRRFQLIYRQIVTAQCGTAQATSNAVEVLIEP